MHSTCRHNVDLVPTCFHSQLLWPRFRANVTFCENQEQKQFCRCCLFTSANFNVKKKTHNTFSENPLFYSWENQISPLKRWKKERILPQKRWNILIGNFPLHTCTNQQDERKKKTQPKLHNSQLKEPKVLMQKTKAECKTSSISEINKQNKLTHKFPDITKTRNSGIFRN